MLPWNSLEMLSLSFGLLCCGLSPAVSSRMGQLLPTLSSHWSPQVGLEALRNPWSSLCWLGVWFTHLRKISHNFETEILLFQLPVNLKMKPIRMTQFLSFLVGS